MSNEENYDRIVSQIETADLPEAWLSVLENHVQNKKLERARLDRLENNPGTLGD